MRNLTPSGIVFLGSAVISGLTLLILFVLKGIINLDWWLVFLLPVLIGVATYILFYYLLKIFISERIKILYRSIRKGKLSVTESKRFDMNKDVIALAEEDTKKWTDDRIKEISKLKDQEEFRREFLGNLAHELKTPVFSIQGYILTLLEGGLEDKKINRKFLQRASKATERMTDILDDLDQITRFEVDKIEIDKKEFDIVELVQDVFEDLEQMSDTKGVNLTLNKEYKSILVKADKSKIGQVITNLIRNSIAYGNEDGETTVRFYKMDGIVTVEIADNGMGIDEEHLPRLFERFYRVEKSRNRHEGGSGLGLSIVKHILEAHNQTISVRSTVGVGSTFTFGLEAAK